MVTNSFIRENYQICNGLLQKYLNQEKLSTLLSEIRYTVLDFKNEIQEAIQL